MKMKNLDTPQGARVRGTPLRRSNRYLQWRIQDSPEGEGNQLGGGGLNLLFGIIFAENCMKKKKIRLRVRAGFPHTPRSTTD